MDQEDSLDLARSRSVQFKPDLIHVAVVLLPRMSNFTDFNALVAEKDVAIRFASSPDDLRGAVVVIIPGSKNTLEDLNYLMMSGFSGALKSHVIRGAELVGICGGGVSDAWARDHGPQGIGAGRNVNRLRLSRYNDGA